MIQQNILQSVNSIAAQLKAKYSDLTPILEQISAIIQSAIDDNFDQRGRWDGVGTSLLSGGNMRWTPLAQSTKKRYAKLGYELQPTLRRTGILQSSIETRPYGKGSIIISSNLEYAAAHQFGIKRKSLPARPFITLTEKDVQDIINKLLSFLQLTNKSLS